MELSTLRRRLISLLAEEIETYLPQFEPYASDYQMVLYACGDLEEWIECKWAMDSRGRVHERIEEIIEHEPGFFRVFLNFWAGLWLEKWRERVKVLSAKPRLPPEVLKKIKEARRLLQEMEQRSELKKMVTQKLISQGEICMSEVIAENLIIEEIARRIRIVNEDSTRLTIIDPLSVLNSLSQRISRLSEEKGPLIYLNIKPHML